MSRHTQQQQRLAKPSAGTRAQGIPNAQRQRSNQAVLRRAEYLERLALDPGEAHEVWRRLSEADRKIVAERMLRHFGPEFTKQFLDAAKAGTGRSLVKYLQPGSPGSKPEELLAAGFRRGGVERTGSGDINVEVWVHPLGTFSRRDLRGLEMAPPDEEADQEEEDQEEEDEEGEEEWDEVGIAPPNEWRVRRMLERLNEANDNLANICSAAEFRPAEARKVQRKFRSALDVLQSQLPGVNLDWQFWADYHEAINLHEQLRSQCMSRK